MSKQQEREQKILAFMRKELKAKGYPPTVREIGTALGIKSTSTVHKDIASLVEQGYLKKDPAKPRALMLVDSDTPDTAGEISNVSSSREDVVDVPVVGNVAAGKHRRYISRARRLRERRQLYAEGQRREHGKCGNHGRRPDSRSAAEHCI